MPRIFISYRRDDSAFVAHQLHARLRERFGAASIFFDVESIPPGDNFVARLKEAVGRCDVLLALIGDRWLDAGFDDGPQKGKRRLDDPEDWVRVEIASALRANIPVIPVLVGKVSMAQLAPGLPAELGELKTRNTTAVRAGRDLEHDLHAIVRGIREVSRLPPLTAADLALPPGVAIAPKGLRSFDADDSAFFTRLLPGPHRPDGQPCSIHFWQHRIERTTAENSFRVGVIYGPSGCGKSSLVKAGLLPALAGRVTPVYVEATAGDTENRLYNAVGKQRPAFADGSILATALAHKAKLPAGQKVLIVLDQFEQWLHAAPDDEQQGLAEALGECDGVRLQCLLLVRDDFLTPVTRFMNRLGIPLQGDENCALVDLFDRAHAKKVLALLGQAYGALPKTGCLEPEQDEFLNRAVAGLAQEGRVICVRLALLAQMMKDKQWTPATLKAMGGAHGVGVAFLEDSFAGDAAPLEVRRHQRAAERVLAALLPKSGASIRGSMRTARELLAKSGCRRADFDELLGILDGKFRLITPIDPSGHPLAGRRSAEDAGHRVDDDAHCYQLTHDYLVPALREWLARKQRESRRGRAELRLTERAEAWHRKPENRHLPAWWEMINIRALVPKTEWTESQKAMMRKAGRYYAVCSALLAALWAVVAVCIIALRAQTAERENANHAADLVQRLMDADTAQAPRIVGEMGPYWRWTHLLLKDAFANAPPKSERKLNASLGLLPVDPTQADYLYESLLAAEPREVPVICQALSPMRDRFTEKLWNVVEQPSPQREKQLLPAACALAAYDPNNARWNGAAAAVADRLLAENPLLLGLWIDALRPVRDRLLDPLATAMRDAARPESARLAAAGILADYASDRAALLADLTMDADENQFALLLPKLKQAGRGAIEPLLAEIDKRLVPQWNDQPLKSVADKPDAAAVRAIESAEGVMADQFAFCQTMPLDAFGPTSESLRKAGYRPTRFRPFPTAGGVLVAAIWRRDGQDWRSAVGVSAQDLSKQDKKYGDQRFTPADLSRYFINHKEQYAALWTPLSRDLTSRTLYLGFDWTQVTTTLVAAQKDGYRTMVIDCFYDNDGTARCSLILGKARDERDHLSVFFRGIEAKYAGDDHAGDLEVDVQINQTDASPDGQPPLAAQGKNLQQKPVEVATPTAPAGQASDAAPGRRYAAVWHDSSRFASTEVHGVDPAAHLVRCRELIAQQYRPASISVAEFTRGQRVAASVWQRPLLPDDQLEKHVKRQAAAAAALVEMDMPEKIWPLLALSSDPRLRSYVIDQLGRSPHVAAPIAERLKSESSVDIRRALLLVLGELDPSALPPAERGALLERLRDSYDAEDPGLHAAAEWAMRQWKQDAWLKQSQQQRADGHRGSDPQAAIVPGSGDDARPQWYVNGQGQTMVVVPGPVGFFMGSQRNEVGRADNETLHRQSVGRRFALAAQLVTVDQFRRFDPGFHVPIQNAPEIDCPVIGVKWYKAAEYCNWLSRQEGLPDKELCYQPNDKGSFDEGMMTVPGFLNRVGYRLPTEAEWEYACRAGAVTARYFGQSETLLPNYAWYAGKAKDRSWPVGALKPNDMGLFDMHGNAWQWCQDIYKPYDQPLGGRTLDEVRENGPLQEKVPVLEKDSRVVRGGAFFVLSRYLRSAFRNFNHPGNQGYGNGFRVARTVR